MKQSTETHTISRRWLLICYCRSFQVTSVVHFKYVQIIPQIHTLLNIYPPTYNLKCHLYQFVRLNLHTDIIEKVTCFSTFNFVFYLLMNKGSFIQFRMLASLKLPHCRAFLCQFYFSCTKLYVGTCLQRAPINVLKRVPPLTP